MDKPTTIYLEKLTDDFGVWQHASKEGIDKEQGYALDDASRALIVFLLYKKFDHAKICLNYIEKSVKDGLFIGFFNKERKEIVYPSSYDAATLTIWSLCFSIKAEFEIDRCKAILDKVDFNKFNDNHIRGLSYLTIAENLYNIPEISDYPHDILSRYNNNNWFEDKLTYANAVIPLALIEFYSKNIGDQHLEYIIKNSINTLESQMRIGTIPSPVGNREWHKIGDVKKDVYGQQPIDAGFMVIMFCRAYEVFKDDLYLKKATEWMEWFYGNNIFKKSLINEEFACCDGIDEPGLSKNYGAESTIIYLWASKVLENVSTQS